MARLFISHSSADNAVAIGLHSWLAANGWDDIFLDVDAERGLKPGTRWQEALRQAQARCEAVLVLISPAWLASDWCRTEYLLASQLNKRIFAAMIAPVPIDQLPATLTAEWQVVDLTQPEKDERLPGSDLALSSVGLRKLRHGLGEAGIDATHFPWPPQGDADRPPYPGLRALDEADAGIFFGRDGQIVLAMDALRGLREATPGGVFAVLGASGAGKSSFLRAGLVPRLRRDDRRFLVLPVLRPGRAAMSGETGLLALLARALADAGHGQSRVAVRQLLADDLAGLVQRLGGGAERCLVLCVDQAEECLDHDEGAELLSVVARLAALPRTRFTAILAVRSDRWEAVQSHAALEGVAQTLFSLPPMPPGAFGDVIRKPALRLSQSGRALAVEEQLVDTLLSDVANGGARDSLPLLAFTLEGLWRDEGATGRLSLANYQASGGLRGAIEAAVARALRRAEADRRIPVDRQAQLLLLRRGFIPWLAGIDPETGSPRRRVALLSEIPEEARPLIDILVEERLLTKDIDAASGETVLEPAHEALLRQWGVMGTWLGEALQDLTTVEGIRRASRDWAANAQDRDWLVHADARLALAADVARKPDFAALLKATDRAYLSGCLAAAEARHARVRRLRRLRNGAVAAAFIAISAGSAVLWMLWSQAERSRIAAASSLLMLESRTFREDGRADLALQSAAQAFGLTDTEGTRSAFATAVLAVPDRLDRVLDLGTPAPASIAFLPDGGLVAAALDGRGSILRPGIAPVAVALAPEAAPMDGSKQRLVALVATAQGVVAIFGDGAVQAMSSDGVVTAQKPGGPGVIVAAPGGISADRSGRVIAVGNAGTLSLIDCRVAMCATRDIPLSEPLSLSDAGLALAPDASSLRYQSQAGPWLLDLRTGEVSAMPPAAHPEAQGPALLAPQGDRIAFACRGASVCVAPKAGEARPVLELPGEQAALLAFDWSPDGTRMATLHLDGLIRFWRVEPAAPGESADSAEPVVSAAAGFDPHRQVREALQQRFGGLQLRDLRSGQTASFDPADWSGVTRLSVSADGQVLALPFRNAQVAVLTPEPPAGASLLGSDPLPARPTGAVLDPARSLAYVATTDGAIRRVSLTDGREAAMLVPPAVPAPHAPRAVGATSLSLGADGRMLAASQSANGAELAVYAAGDGSVIHRLALDFPDPKIVAFSPDSRSLAVMLGNGQFDLWDLTSTARRVFWVPLARGGALPAGVRWDGPQRLIITTQSGASRLFSLQPADWLARADALRQASQQINLQESP